MLLAHLVSHIPQSGGPSYRPFVISYFDQIKGSGSFAEFTDRSQELIEALDEIGRAAGDETHTSGRADYVVRLTTPSWTSQTIPAKNGFVVAADADSVSVMTKIEDGDLVPVTRFNATDPWFDGVREEFQAFRDQLETASLG